MQGNVTLNGSLFSLEDPDFDSSFVPGFYDTIDDLFGNNTVLKQNAIEICGGTSSFICLFDVALTGDRTSSTESQSSLEAFETEKKTLGMFLFQSLLARAFLTKRSLNDSLHVLMLAKFT